MTINTIQYKVVIAGNMGYSLIVGTTMLSHAILLHASSATIIVSHCGKMDNNIVMCFV